MKNIEKHLTAKEIEMRRERRLEAMHLQEIEGNPLSSEQVKMFEMFEREGWSDERCHEYVMKRALELAAKSQNNR